jgi:predicted transposase/invertase (TIGR01784 family)
LINLLQSMLKLEEDDYDTIEISDPHLLPEYADDKYAIIDVKLHTKSRKVIHIEIQLKITPELKKRLIFYESRLITEQLSAGSSYDTIQNVISIVITDKTLIEKSPRYHHRFTFFDHEAGVEFTDLVAIHTLELNKLPEAADGTQLYDWASFIAAMSEEELAVVAERNPQIKKAVVKLRALSADEQARDLYERREKSRRDEESQLRWARIEGRQEGIFDVARNALRMKMSVEDVMELTGLSRKEIEALRREPNRYKLNNRLICTGVMQPVVCYSKNNDPRGHEKTMGGRLF